MILPRGGGLIFLGAVTFATTVIRLGVPLAWLRDYAESRIDSRLFDERRTISPHVVLDLGRIGVLGLRAPLEVGGSAQ